MRYSIQLYCLRKWGTEGEQFTYGAKTREVTIEAPIAIANSLSRENVYWRPEDEYVAKVCSVCIGGGGIFLTPVRCGDGLSSLGVCCVVAKIDLGAPLLHVYIDELRRNPFRVRGREL